MILARDSFNKRKWTPMQDAHTVGRTHFMVTHEEAEGIAIQALTFLAVEPPRLWRFFKLTGLDPDSLRLTTNEPGFLMAVLDYVLQDESLLFVFCEHCEIDPAFVSPARDRLAYTKARTG